MVLALHGVHLSQNQFAEEMNTNPVSGTEYADLARAVNKYVFHDEQIQEGEPGYRVQTFARNYEDPQTAITLETRIRTNIAAHDPIFTAINLQALYPKLPSANHMILIIGYAVDRKTDQIAYYYIIDPYDKVQDPIYGGLKTFTVDELVEAMIVNEEPAYIW